MHIDKDIIIRKAISKDINAIIKIEQQRFPNPWKKDFFAREIGHDIAFFYVAEDPETHGIIGYIIFWIIQEIVELHKIAAALDTSKKGIGKKLFNFMLETSKEKKAEKIFLEVRKSNAKAIKFYQSNNCQYTGNRKDYYNNPKEDALLYTIII